MGILPQSKLRASTPSPLLLTVSASLFSFRQKDMLPRSFPPKLYQTNPQLRSKPSLSLHVLSPWQISIAIRQTTSIFVTALTAKHFISVLQDPSSHRQFVTPQASLSGTALTSRASTTPSTAGAF